MPSVDKLVALAASAEIEVRRLCDDSIFLTHSARKLLDEIVVNLSRGNPPGLLATSGLARIARRLQRNRARIIDLNNFRDKLAEAGVTIPTEEEESDD